MTQHSFRQWLHTLERNELHTLLHQRPDAISPPPPGIMALAERLLLPASLRRAVRKLNAFDIAVLHTASKLGAEFSPIVAPDLVQALPDHPEIAAFTTESIARLRALGVMMDFDEGLMVLPGVLNALPPGLESTDTDPEQIQALLGALDERALAILNTLANSNGTGTTREAAVDADPTRPIPRLIAQGLLTRVNAHTVRLPATVRALLRGRSPIARSVLPPDFEPAENPGSNDAATAAGLEVVRLMRALIEHLGQEPGVLVKSGALAVRTTNTLRKALDVSELDLARLIHVGIAARLIGRGEPTPLPDNDTGGDYLTPTNEADTWLALTLGEQWARLLHAWYYKQRYTTDERLKILAEETHHAELSEQRQAILTAAIQANPSLEKVTQRFAYEHPIMALGVSAGDVDKHLAEAVWIGLLGPRLEATAQLLGVIDGDATSACLEATPGAVDKLIPQGDMTVLAPGPLEPEVHAKMKVLADAESQGLASVYRISDASIRRGLDAGYTASDIKQFLQEHTIGDVPQAMLYAVDDAARKHGTIRGGAALSYIRSEDPSLIEEAMRVEPRLRGIAPNVAVAQVPLAAIMQTLRAAGLMPVAEDDQGMSIDTRLRPSRLQISPEHPHQDDQQERVLAALDAIEANREVAETTGTTSSRETLSLLRAAVRANERVVLGFVENTGRVERSVVTPVDVSAGWLVAVDPATGDLQRIALHRISEVGTVR